VADVSSHSLAKHSERYAQNLESLLSKRQHANDRTADDPTSPDSRAAAVANEFPGFGDPGHASREEMSYSTLPTAAERATEPAARANAAMKVAGRPDGPAATTQASAPALQPKGAPHAPTDAEPPAAETAAAKAVAKPQTAVSANDLLQTLSRRIKDDPRDTAGHLNYQLLQFLLDEQVPDLQSIASLPAEDREVLTTLLDGLSNFRNGLRAEANSLQSKKVAPLLELAERLRSQGELSISTAALCRNVQRFGVYDPMEPPRFIAGGKNNDAILYCEVANFSSQLNDQKLWETKLKQEAVLYSESGLSVWSDKTDTVVDHSRNRLHDFFIADKIRLPASLPVGRYLMKMTVTDLHANRVAEATVPIQVVAQ
jgi:hypothetical protein